MSASRLLSTAHPTCESDLPPMYNRVSSLIQDNNYASDTSLSLFSFSNPPNVLVSPKGIIHVLGYTPKEGECGVPVTVRLHFRCDLSDPIYVRLLVGHKPVPTKVREVSGSVYGRWQLDATVPSHEEEKPSTKVLLSVQALNSENVIVDAIAFGEFSYWTTSCSPRGHEGLAQSPGMQSNGPTNVIPVRSRRLTSHVQRRTPDRPSSPKPSQQVRLQRRMKTQSLMRTRSGVASELGEELYAQAPILDLVTPLNSICADWTPAEFQAGRRLVRFGKVQDGRRLIVSCEPISQEEYCEQDTVISCIYREESDTCFVTSVDVIYLLERLTNGEFPVEEKNRIRRNLEGLRPTTVSKHKLGYEDFFQRIMEFPDPKPRNIEKDLKVFKWNLLGQALEKILSKYSIYTAAVEGHADSAPSDTPLSEVSDSVVQHLPYSPSEGLEQVYRETNGAIKPEPVADNVHISSEETDVQVSVFDGGPTQLVYPLYDTDVHAIHATESDSQSVWCSDYKSGAISYDNYGALTYDIAEHVPTSGNYSDGSGYELSPYDLPFL